MQEPLKIIFLLEDLCYGGTQKQNLALATRLDRNLFSPHILTLTGPTDLDPIVREAGLPLSYMGNDRRVMPVFFVTLGKKLKDLKPDILLPCTALPNIWGRIWAKITGVPVIVGTCRGGGAPLRQHERFLWRFTHNIVCNSQELVSSMCQYGVPKEHLTYIPNGVDCEYFKPVQQKIEKKEKLIVCVARLAKDKDHKTLLTAFNQVFAEYPEVSLRLVGEGPEENNLRRFVAESMASRVADKVEFAGACSNPLPHYREADIFALASEREGQPNVILEAMSCGLPVCATNVGGIPGLIAHNQNGLLSPSHDAQKLAANLLQLLRNPEIAAKMGEHGRAVAERNFSFDAMVNAHQNLFIRLWNKKIRRV